VKNSQELGDNWEFSREENFKQVVEDEDGS